MILSHSLGPKTYVISILFICEQYLVNLMNLAVNDFYHLIKWLLIVKIRRRYLEWLPKYCLTKQSSREKIDSAVKSASCLFATGRHSIMPRVAN